jgi:Putative abortive phage resistance protein AbiGi, antitoxin
MLGYRGNSGWRDMSEYVVHFCRTREALIAILTSGAVEGLTPFGWSREFEQERDAARERREKLSDYPTQKSVCLSEVPLDLLDRLVERRGPWGLGFTKQSVVDDGGAPVWYVEKDTELALALTRVQQSLTAVSQRREWHRITAFIDKVGEFPNGTVYRFEWEREWRVPRRLDLGAGHPAFLFAPTAEHAQLVTDLTAQGVAETLHGIAPLLDPHVGRVSIAGSPEPARPVSPSAYLRP